ncbi:hypothetical protein N0V90_006041 [Kalmusia sp. IMI 367209]|nr:hypothetical protein N0V90_006041 [Kalmusia sp. IMI 367209]
MSAQPKLKKRRQVAQRVDDTSKKQDGSQDNEILELQFLITDLKDQLITKDMAVSNLEFEKGEHSKKILYLEEALKFFEHHFGEYEKVKMKKDEEAKASTASGDTQIRSQSLCSATAPSAENMERTPYTTISPQESGRKDPASLSKANESVRRGGASSRAHVGQHEFEGAPALGAYAAFDSCHKSVSRAGTVAFENTATSRIRNTQSSRFDVAASGNAAQRPRPAPSSPINTAETATLAAADALRLDNLAHSTATLASALSRGSASTVGSAVARSPRRRGGTVRGRLAPQARISAQVNFPSQGLLTKGKNSSSIGNGVSGGSGATRDNGATRNAQGSGSSRSRPTFFSNTVPRGGGKIIRDGRATARGGHTSVATPRSGDTLKSGPAASDSSADT